MTDTLKEKLDCLYVQYNKRDYIDPDPLLFLYNYPEKADREIAGFIAASFAYGRVEMIMKTVAVILDVLGPRPVQYLLNQSESDLGKTFEGFRYRFAKTSDLVDLLMGLKQVAISFGSLENCFIEGLDEDDETVLSGLRFLCRQIRGQRNLEHLLADPFKNSACKRSHLFLRWMVRKDDVDPGGWHWVSSSKLIVPLDMHMHRAGRLLGFTQRKSADLKTAMEITKGFRQISPDDPVKYDFCLTRFGIRREMTMDTLHELVCELEEK